MFLTHMPLNPQRQSTKQLVASPQRMHAAVLSAFVPGYAEADRVLWRLDTPQPHRLELYIVSPVQPSLEAMVDQAGWSANPVWRSANYERLLNSLGTGQRWVFRLRANPVVSVRAFGNDRGKRVPLQRTEEQERWLIERSGRLGFSVVDGEDGGSNLRVNDRQRLAFRRRHGETARTVTLATCMFDGLLEVRDPDAMRLALTGGVGPAKGYGCGLMTLAKST